MNSLEAEVRKHIQVSEEKRFEVAFQIDVVLALNEYHALYHERERLEHTLEWRGKYIADYLMEKGLYLPK